MAAAQSFKVGMVASSAFGLHPTSLQEALVHFRACQERANTSVNACAVHDENNVVSAYCGDSWNSECSTATPSECDSDEIQSRTHQVATSQKRFRLCNKRLPKCRPPPGLIHPSMEALALEANVVHVAISNDPYMGTYTPGKIFQREAASIEESVGCDDSAFECEALTAARSLGTSRNEVAGVFGCPSAGSIGHFYGICKPCDFVSRGGCRLGVECNFCHLCGIQENKMRKKQHRQKHTINAVGSFQSGVAACPGVRYS